MPVDAVEEGGGLVRITLQGRMAPADHAALLYFVTRALEGASAVRLLIVLDGFAGWKGGAEWADEDLRLRDDSKVAQVAIAGEERWKEDVFAFIGQPFRRMPIEYFGSEAAARSWLGT